MKALALPLLITLSVVGCQPAIPAEPAAPPAPAPSSPSIAPPQPSAPRSVEPQPAPPPSSPDADLFKRLPDKQLTYTAQTSKTTRLLAQHASWAAASPDQKHIVVGGAGNGRLLPEGRQIPFPKVNEKTEWGPDGLSVLVPLDDMKSGKAVPTPGFVVLAVPSLNVLARFEGNEAKYVSASLVAFRVGKQAMKIAFKEPNAKPQPVGVVQTTFGCPVVDHYNLTLPVGGTPLCPEPFTTQIEHVDAGMTGWLVSDTRQHRTYSLRAVVLATGESKDLVRFEPDVASSWRDGAKPDIHVVRVLAAPDGSMACAGILTRREKAANDEYELRCGPLPGGPLKTILRDKPGNLDHDMVVMKGLGVFLNQTAAQPHWLEPGKKILVADNVIDLEARTVQHLRFPSAETSINIWRYALPGGKKYVISHLSPPIMVDVAAGTFEPFGRTHGEHDAAFIVPGTDKRIIVTEDNVPGAAGETAGWLYWVDF